MSIVFTQQKFQFWLKYMEREMKIRPKVFVINDYNLIDNSRPARGWAWIFPIPFAEFRQYCVDHNKRRVNIHINKLFQEWRTRLNMKWDYDNKTNCLQLSPTKGMNFYTVSRF